MEQLTVSQIKEMVDSAAPDELAVLERSLASDGRRGVQSALAAARRRHDAAAAERARVDAMYELEARLVREAGAQAAVGLDEVGRGPMAGPLAVGAVVLPRDVRIAHLNDSKQLSEAARMEIAAQVRETAVAWTVQYVSAEQIDKQGISTALRGAFLDAVREIEKHVQVGAIFLDGNPMRLDSREINMVKGDSRLASVAAASVVAKVERDALMVKLDAEFPGYGFAQNKGYGTEAHRAAIARLGLSPIHRKSFCGEFLQGSLF